MPRTLVMVTPVTRDPGLCFRCCDLHLRAAMSPQRRGSVSCAHHPPQRRRWLLGSDTVRDTSTHGVFGGWADGEGQSEGRHQGGEL